MPRYFFHLRDGDQTDDEEGVDLPGVDAAREFAVECARDIVCADIRQGWLNLEHSIDVVDQRGAHVLTMPFRDAFAVHR